MKTHKNQLSASSPRAFFPRREYFPSALSAGARLWPLLLLLAVGRLLAADGPSTDTTQPPASNSAAPAVKVSATTSNAGAAATGSIYVLDDKHQLAIGDQISFRIVEDEDDPKALTVTDSGELEVPYIGRFSAVGKTCKQLAAQLRTELEKEYYKRATVIIAVNVMAKSRGRVYLVGPVHLPGPQEIPSDEVLTLSKAILRAGDFTDFADKKNVRVTRHSKVAGGKDETFTINVGKILDKGGTESDLPLEPGDLIYVPEKLVRF
jgi:protein involved in polysaccharide export with SLBB domain